MTSQLITQCITGPDNCYTDTWKWLLSLLAIHVVHGHIHGLQCNKTKYFTLRWRHNGHDSVSNHQHHHCLLNRLFRRRSKKTSKLRVTGLCVGNSPGTGEFPAQMASNAENVSIWWRHHDSSWQWYRLCMYIINRTSTRPTCHNTIFSNR